MVELAFQAHIANASELAPADSNVVYYRYTIAKPETPEPEPPVIR